LTYLDIITSLVGCKHEADAIHFVLTREFRPVPHILLLHNLSALGVSGGYVNSFRSYIYNQQSQGRVSGIVSSHFEVFCRLPQESVMGHMLFRVFTNSLRGGINYARYQFSDDDIKIYCAVKCPKNCNLLQADIVSVQCGCNANYMKVNAYKTRDKSFS
jgi:hypothetical protein